MRGGAARTIFVVSESARLSRQQLQELREHAKRIMDDADAERVPASNLARRAASLAFTMNQIDFGRKFDIAAKDLATIEAQLRNAEQSVVNAATGKNPFDHPSYYQMAVAKHARELGEWKSTIYQYAAGAYFRGLAGQVASSVFDRVRARVDAAIEQYLPEGSTRLASAYQGLTSENLQDWANAVHTCRRLLKELADAVYPATSDPRYADDKYINRLAAFVDSRSSSEKFSKIVGAQIEYLGNRVDAIYEASNKGSHTDVDQEEADRYVIYTYLLIGDILVLASA